MKALDLLRIEFLKNRRTKTLLVVALMLFLEVAFLSLSQIRMNFEQKTWLVMYLQFPILNAVFIPVIMALLASRNVDIENKGEVWKLLYTFEDQMQFFWVKLLYGVMTIFFVLAAQSFFMLISGSLQGMIDFRWTWFGEYLLNTFLACLVIYLFQLVLSFGFKNQTISLSAGLASALLGLFILFLPKAISMLVPMGVFGYTAFANSDYDVDTRIVTVFEQWPSLTDYIPALLWIGVLLFVSVKVFTNEESEENALGALLSRFSFGRKEKHSVGTFSRILPEMIKIKKSLIWLPFIILPILSSIIGTVNYWQNRDVLTNGWYSLWGQHTLFLCFFFYPAAVAVACGILCRFEHKGANWNQILVCTTPTRIVLEKLLASVVTSMLGLIWIALLFVVEGKIAGIEGMPPTKLLEWIACGMVASMSVCSIHLYLSLRIRNFAIPIGLGLFGGVVGLAFLVWEIPYYCPYSLFSIGMRANNPDLLINIPKLIIMSVMFTFIFLAASIRYINESDVKTNN